MGSGLFSFFASACWTVPGYLAASWVGLFSAKERGSYLWYSDCSSNYGAYEVGRFRTWSSNLAIKDLGGSSYLDVQDPAPPPFYRLFSPRKSLSSAKSTSFSKISSIDLSPIPLADGYLSSPLNLSSLDLSLLATELNNDLSALSTLSLLGGSVISYQAC